MPAAASFYALFYRFCSGFFLRLFQGLLEKALFLLGSYRSLAVESLYVSDVDTADNGFDFLLNRYGVKNLFIADKGKDLRPYLCLYDGKLGTPHELGSLIDDYLGKTSFLHFHALLINNQHGNSLLHGLYLGLLFFLTLLSLFSKEI